MSERTDREIDALLAFELVPPPVDPRIERELAEITPITTRRPRRQFVVVLVGAAVVFSALLAVLGLRADLHQLPAGWIPVVAGLWVVGLVLAAWFALVPRPGSVMPRWRLASLVVAVTSCAYVILGLLVHPSGSSSLFYGRERFAAGHGCLELGLMTAIVPVALGTWFLRGTAPVRTRWIAALLGAAGGCVGGLLLHFYCRIADGLHIGLIHGGVVGTAALIAALVVPRVIVTRS